MRPSLSKRYNAFLIGVLSILGAAMAGILALTYAADPFAEHANEDGIYFANSPATVQRYRTLLAEQPCVLVFGTSRSELISDEFVGDRVINLHAIYGWPDSVLAFLQKLDAVEVRHIRRIIYLLDLQTMVPPPASALEFPDGAPERFAYRIRNLRSYATESVKRLALLATRTYKFHVHPRGFTMQDRPVTFEGGFVGVESQDFDPATIAKLAEIRSFGQRRHISIDFITPVLPDAQIKRLDMALLGGERRSFVRVLGHYVELTHLPGVSDHPEMFRDSSHLNRDGMRALFARYPWRDRIATAKTVDGFLSDIAHAAVR